MKGFNLDILNKNILVTGGANGIGKELVKALIKEGSNVGVIDSDNNSLNKIKSEFSKVFSFYCDVTKIKDLEKAINKFYNSVGQIDVLVNNAGILYSEPLICFNSKGIQKHSYNHWKKVMDVNLNSVFYVSCSVVSKMVEKRTKGVIVNISSISAAGNSGQSAYSAAKAGVNALTSTWSKELSALGIRVLGISPGYSDTNSTHKALNQSIINNLKKEIPLKRLGKPKEIVNAIMFGIKNDYMNGKIIEIDGGLIVT